MEKKDKRMNILTETINNIKIIKLNSYIPEFLQKILQRRKDEIVAYYKRFIFGACNITIGTMSAPILVMISFTVLIAHGFEISVSSAFAAVNILNMLRGSIRWLPNFIGSFMEFRVSINRIQDYL